MEWIETTGKTVEEAKERALEELGIDEDELEYEVVQEPRGGLLGRIGGASAHVRARVRPISREKPERARRRGRRGGQRGRSSPRSGDRGGRGGGKQRQGGNGAKSGGRGSRSGGEPQRKSGKQSGKQSGKSKGTAKSEEQPMSEVPVEEQAEMAEEFAQGLVDAFGLDGSATARPDDERVLVEIDGDDVGVLIGRDGAVMEAIRELVKTSLQRQTEGHNARISIDVGGYNAKRREALEEFARELAERAIETGRAQALEPMSPPDRKVVHDAVNEIDGVTTESEGEDPRRRVVITPSS